MMSFSKKSPCIQVLLQKNKKCFTVNVITEEVFKWYAVKIFTQGILAVDQLRILFQIAD